VVVLLLLAVGVAFFPGQVPGLTVPGSPSAMRAMDSMSMHDAPAHESQMQGMSP
jgi:hypothetical protein